MAAVHVYLNFNGNCEEAFTFYKEAFGGEFSYIGKFGDMPPNENHPIAEADKNKVMHVSFPIGETVLMGSDTGGEWASNLVVGNNFAVSINANSTAEADHLFTKLAAGGKVTMPMEKTFWGAYFGMFTDKFGINWMVNFDE
ncbi:VOC family protein [Flavobacterium agricola]|uniref:VOC family protein n=1 Tax=Flavobacterium agricola TaxID=2870839 RepID=A0ABY6M2B1_9FLAO|nr:VOC family protein [Flavobacterium agricola]UYW01917.1 VOC family protein [Flavobacterium agricola]